MEIDPRRFPATATDLALLPSDTELSFGDSGRMVAVSCPSRADFAGGNCVYVAHEGGALDLERAVTLWTEHVAADMGLHQIRIVIEVPRTLPPLPLDPEWDEERRTILQRTAPVTFDAGPDPRIQRCERLGQWESLWQLLAASHPTASGDFIAWRVEQLRRLSARMRGGMWAWCEDEMALACAGGFEVGPLWRFQDVATHPEHRRHGLATAVCKQVCQHAAGATCTIVASQGHAAVQLYEALGFQPVGTQHVWTARLPI